MKVPLHTCALGLFLALTSACTAGTPTPHAIAPHSIAWKCARNTAQMAQVYLTNAGLIDQTQIDNSKTEVRLLLKKSFGHERYESVYDLVLHQTDGKSIHIIAESTREDSECPSQDVKVFVVSRELGQLPSRHWIDVKQTP